jgi:hypothetical protein
MARPGPSLGWNIFGISRIESLMLYLDASAYKSESFTEGDDTCVESESGAYSLLISDPISLARLVVAAPPPPQ